MMVTTRRMAGKQAVSSIALKPAVLAEQMMRTPKKRTRPAPRTPSKRRLCVAGAAVQPEKLDARVSLRKGMRQLEQQLHDDGFKCVVGVDEAGRGPLVRCARFESVDLCCWLTCCSLLLCCSVVL